MSLVSIRVSRETREVLRMIAAHAHCPMSAIVHDAAMAYRNELLWRRADADYTRLCRRQPAPPGDSSSLRSLGMIERWIIAGMGTVQIR